MNKTPETYRAVLDIDGIEFYSTARQFLTKTEALEFFFQEYGQYLKEVEGRDQGEWWVV